MSAKDKVLKEINDLMQNPDINTFEFKIKMDKKVFLI